MKKLLDDLQDRIARVRDSTGMCKLCGERFLDWEEMVRHLRNSPRCASFAGIEIRELNKTLKCKLCGATFPNYEDHAETCPGLKIDFDCTKKRIHPALDFDGTTLYIMQNLYSKAGGAAPFILTSNRLSYPLGGENEKNLPFSLKMKPHKMPNRWSTSSIQEFLKGEAQNIGINEVYKKVKEALVFHYDFQNPNHARFISLWVLATYYWPVFRVMPYIYFSAPRNTGKSKMLNLLTEMCFEGEFVISPSDSSIFRATGECKSTLLFDEVRRMSEHAEENLLLMLRGGYKDGASVPRVDKLADGTLARVRFEVGGPKAFANLKELPDDVLSRAFTINLSRAKNSVIANREVNMYPFWQGIRDSLYLCVMQNSKAVYDTLPLFDSTLEELTTRGEEGGGTFSYLSSYILINKIKHMPEVNAENTLLNDGSMSNRTPPSSPLPPNLKLSNRSLEVMKPIIILAHFIDPVERGFVLDYIMDSYAAKENDEDSESWDSRILQALRDVCFEVQDGKVVEREEIFGSRERPVISPWLVLGKLEEEANDAKEQLPEFLKESFIGRVFVRFGVGPGQIFERRKKVRGRYVYEINKAQMLEYFERMLPKGGRMGEAGRLNLG